MEALNLAGSWKVVPDLEDRGIEENWPISKDPQEGYPINLPGCLEENRIGPPVDSKTVWTGSEFGKEFYADDLYKPYRTDRDYRFIYWLQPETRYLGPAWYFKEISFPEPINSRFWELYLERTHWETKVWFDGRFLGTEDSLCVPHRYILILPEGKKGGQLAVRVDNRMIHDVGPNAHSVSDQTQGSWNGIAGKIELRPVGDCSILSTDFHGNTERKSGLVKIRILNRREEHVKCRLNLDSVVRRKESGLQTVSEVVLKPGENFFYREIGFEDSVGCWDEHNPSLISVDIALQDADGMQVLDRKTLNTGLRDVKTEDKKILINGRPISLRGTLECCVFPKTGYPSTDKNTWSGIYEKLKSYGMNHIRFHSWCPPEAAFQAADEQGIYLQIECPVWKNQGSRYEGDPDFDNWIFAESERVISEYGNHPSFILFNSGNEPDGRHENFLGLWLRYWKSRDGRRLYTSSAGWPAIPENEYHVVPEPRIQAWGEGLDSRINQSHPETVSDYRAICEKYTGPVITHENGQWCAFPDFSEIPEYTGYLKPKNLEVFRDILKRRGLEHKAEEFLHASGKLQTLCYKEEIESALRTENLSGFQLLGLTDFPGQGTALVGILNAFWKEKGYCAAEDFREFCNERVILARLPKRCFTNNEILTAEIDFYNYSAEESENGSFRCTVLDCRGLKTAQSELVFKGRLGRGLHSIGKISLPLDSFKNPAKYILEIEYRETGIRNHWDFWVFPENPEISYNGITVTGKIGEALEALEREEKVLLLAPPSTVDSEVVTGFSSVFWNTSWTEGQPPHTLGITCDSSHPIFRHFPTENYSNWQWWEPIQHSTAMILDDFPVELEPTIQLIDTWFRSHRLALLFECKTGQGSLMLSSLDFTNLRNKTVSGQLLAGILAYMRSDNFNPEIRIEKQLLKKLFKECYNEYSKKHKSGCTSRRPGPAS